MLGMTAFGSVSFSHARFDRLGITAGGAEAVAKRGA